MTADRREWDLIVVGLGALGSGAAYWASTHPGARVLGLEQFELGHANGASADHSRIIRLSYHRPDYVRLAKRAYETWAEVEAEAGERIVTITGGLDLWPADPAIPKADYTDSLTAEGVPFELLDADEVMRRWPQWRLDDGTTAMFQAQGGLADPFKGNAAHRRLATGRRRDAARPDAGRPPSATSAARCELDAGGVDPPGADRGRRRRRLDQRAAGAVRPPPAADDHQGAGHVLRRARPGRVRAGPLPGLDLDGRPVLLRLPDLRRGRPEGRPGLRRPGRRRRQTRTFERDEAADRARRAPSWAATCPTALGPEIYTKTCLYTLTPDRDFVVDRLPEAPGRRRPAGRGARRSSSPRCWAASRPSWRSTATRRRRRSSSAFRIDRPILLEEAPGDVLDGLEARTCGRRHCTRFAACATVPPLDARERRRWATGDSDRRRRRTRCECPLRARMVRRILAVAGLTAALVLPGAASVHGRGPRRPPGGHDPGPRLAEPVRHDPRRRLRGLRPHLQLPGRFRPEPRAGPRLRRQVGARRRRPLLDLPHPRRHEVVRRRSPRPRPTPASRGSSASTPSRPDETSLGAGYLDPTLKDAGVTKVDCPDPTTMVVDDRRPVGPRAPGRDPDHPQAHLGQGDLQDHRRRPSSTPPLVGTGPYTVDRVADRPVHPARQRNPNYWGTQAFQDEVDIVIYKTRRHDGPGAQGRRARLRPRPQRRPAQPAQDRPEHRDRRRQRQRLDPARLQRLRRRAPARPSRTAARRPRPCSTRRSATPSATRSTTGPLVDRVLGGYGDVGTTIVPPVLTQWHVEPTTPRTFDIEKAKQLLDAAGYKLDANGNRLDKEGKPINLRIFMPNSDDELSEGRRSSSRTGTASSGSRSRPRSPRARRSSARRSCRPRPATSYTADYDIELWGWSGGDRPERPAADLRVRARSAPRPTASTATRPTTRCTRTS